MTRLRRQLERLRGDGLRATLARGSGFAFVISLLGFGLMYLLRFALVKWIGVAYLVYLVWRGRGSKRSVAPAAPGEPQQQRSAGVAHGFGSGTS